MRKVLIAVLCGVITLATGLLFGLRESAGSVSPPAVEPVITTEPTTNTVATQDYRDVYQNGFRIEVLVRGVPLEEYRARGRSYIEALDGAEYSLRISNPLPVRVAVALSVDGLNTIDARRSTAWDASKWIIQPYSSITVSGWQMSTGRARRFYFTGERDSYGARIGRATDLGVISAVFFREREPVAVITPRPRQTEPYYGGEDRSSNAPPSDGSAGTSARAESRNAPNASSAARRQPSLNDEYAATGIGRSVQNNVRWMNLDLIPSATAEVTVRYEFRDGLARLGIYPRPRHDVNALRRREQSSGFEDRGGFSPEP